MLGVTLAVIVLVVILIARYLDPFAIHWSRLYTAQDGEMYRVHPAHPNTNQAANTLASINSNIIELMRGLRHSAASNAQKLVATRLLQRYNPDNLIENSPFDPEKDTSYSIDKGGVLALCLRDKSQSIEDFDTLMFVTLHELTHVATDFIDHPTEFWKTFKYILISAEEILGYVSPDYETNPATYCGITIDYNPRWDQHLDSI